MDSQAEEVLAGGNVAASVVRVGSTVRKPATPATPAVHALLQHLAVAGFDGAPRALGRDDAGRQVLEYVPGVTAYNAGPLTGAELHGVGSLIRGLHDAAETFSPPVDAEWDVAIPPDREDLICHNDLAPWNLVRDGDSWVFIDWDGAGPGSRLWDIAYAAHGFVPFVAGGDAAGDAERLRTLADGYGLDESQRRELPALIEAHTRGMYDLLCHSALTGAQPWARLHAEGHADHWGPAADYIGARLGQWSSALLD
ncbi:MAG TPA: phosphotransferase [Gaiellales bacterium]|nr:phosphotransferase [Gaiellales bacterium]